MMQEVSEVRPPTTWAARGVDGAIRPSATITIEPLDDGLSSRVTFALDFEGQGIGRAVAAVRASADTEGGAAQLPEAQGTCGVKKLNRREGVGSDPHVLVSGDGRVGTAKTGPAAGSNGIAQHGGGVAPPGFAPDSSRHGRPVASARFKRSESRLLGCMLPSFR
jgi:hypothetical protein